MAILLKGLVLAGVAQAHFLLNHPVSIGFIDDNEGDGPCGSFEPDFTNDTITDWHVGGDFISTQLAHPESNILYRATLDKTAAGGWVELFPIVQQTGLGDFCEPSVPGPTSWAGKEGILGIVVNGPDGILFQCAAVNFVSGTGTPNSTTCSNATGVTAALVSDASLTAFANSTSTSNSTGGASAGGNPSSSTSSSPSASGSKSAAASYVEAGHSAVSSLLLVGLMGMLGAALL